MFFKLNVLGKRAPSVCSRLCRDEATIYALKESCSGAFKKKKNDSRRQRRDQNETKTPLFIHLRASFAVAPCEGRVWSRAGPRRACGLRVPGRLRGPERSELPRCAVRSLDVSARCKQRGQDVLAVNKEEIARTEVLARRRNCRSVNELSLGFQPSGIFQRK